MSQGQSRIPKDYFVDPQSAPVATEAPPLGVVTWEDYLGGLTSAVEASRLAGWRNGLNAGFADASARLGATAPPDLEVRAPLFVIRGRDIPEAAVPMPLRAASDRINAASAAEYKGHYQMGRQYGEQAASQAIAVQKAALGEADAKNKRVLVRWGIPILVAGVVVWWLWRRA